MGSKSRVEFISFMSKSTSSNQVFNVGDYVLTSKGKIGVIEKPQGYNLSKSGQNYGENLSLGECDKIMNLFGGTFEQVKVPNEVKLGSKSYPIWSDKLTKLDNLTIRTKQGFSQHVINLPIEDAKLLMDIYTRNNIWFNIE